MSVTLDLARAAAVGKIVRARSLMPMLRRKKDRTFVANLVLTLAENGGELTDDVIANAMEAAFEPLNRDADAARAELIRKGRAKLRLSQVGDAIADFYDVAADMSLAEAAQLHAEHIRGIKYKATVVDDKGKAHTVTMRDKPNYTALKDYLTLALPKEAKRVQVDQRTLVGRMSVGETYDQPAIDPLPIGESS